MGKIKVFLSDPQVLFREGIHFTLSGEEDFEVTGETTNNEEALTQLETNPPDVAILSMQDSKLDGAGLTRRLKRHHSLLSTILIMDKDDEEQLFTALKSGASACLSKDIDPQYLLDLIREVVQGNQPIIDALLIPGMAAKAVSEFEYMATLSEQFDNVLTGLSTKEAEVLNAIAAGKGIEQAITELNTSEEAIRDHLGLIAGKLITNNQTLTVIEAAQRSLPSLITKGLVTNQTETEYITKDEFTEFKENLMERLKSFIGELA